MLWPLAVAHCHLSLCCQTLRYLAESPLNIDIMQNELGMMVSLENLVER